MKDVTDTKLLQVFLSPNQTQGPSIYEVGVTEDGDLQCNCPGFLSRKACKHSKFVQTRIDTNNGQYPLEISNRATDEDTELAKKSTANFRKFIIKYGKIEVF